MKGIEISAVNLGPLADIPYLGPVLFQHDGMVYVSDGRGRVVQLAPARALFCGPWAVTRSPCAGHGQASAWPHCIWWSARRWRLFSLTRAPMDRRHDGGGGLAGLALVVFASETRQVLIASSSAV